MNTSDRILAAERNALEMARQNHQKKRSFDQERIDFKDKFISKQQHHQKHRIQHGDSRFCSLNSMNSSVLKHTEFPTESFVDNSGLYVGFMLSYNGWTRDDLGFERIFLHKSGGTRVWFVVESKYVEHLNRILSETVSESSVRPSELTKHGIPVSIQTQSAASIVVIAPGSAYFYINLSYNLIEMQRFGGTAWLDYARRRVQMDSRSLPYEAVVLRAAFLMNDEKDPEIYRIVAQHASTILCEFMSLSKKWEENGWHCVWMPGVVAKNVLIKQVLEVQLSLKGKRLGSSADYGIECSVCGASSMLAVAICWTCRSLAVCLRHLSSACNVLKHSRLLLLRYSKNELLRKWKHAVPELESWIKDGIPEQRNEILLQNPVEFNQDESDFEYELIEEGFVANWNDNPRETSDQIAEKNRMYDGDEESRDESEEILEEGCFSKRNNESCDVSELYLAPISSGKQHKHSCNENPCRQNDQHAEPENISHEN
eukprot:CAMPEP_0182451362 /NCGR_PEP_ID=MMETSP1172-20130603/43681_1 /TAXON_ID=708627 /ORGANISM="Timspurckia oligopyrenoides, Strain CCMP3278" /LENGTH=484 /DNA_ID=CAMNT_0024649133 /DNA_START=262 /DNA_END=1716 /DNA_ORIENTATION=-